MLDSLLMVTSINKSIDQFVFIICIHKNNYSDLSTGTDLCFNSYTFSILWKNSCGVTWTFKTRIRIKSVSQITCSDH